MKLFTHADHTAKTFASQLGFYPAFNTSIESEISCRNETVHSHEFSDSGYTRHLAKY